VALIAIALPCVASEPAYGVKQAEERIIDLPQDGNKLYVTVIGDSADSKTQKVVGWFSTNPELRNIRAKTHFNVIPTKTELFRDRYAATVAETPCIRVQDADGVVLYQCSGDKVPYSAEATAKAINTQCWERWRQRHQPKPIVEPAPVPAPEPEPVVVQPDVEPEPEPEASFPWGWLVGLVGAGLAVGGLIGFIREYKKLYRSAK
jgi:hypothetical protein